MSYTNKEQKINKQNLTSFALVTKTSYAECYVLIDYQVPLSSTPLE